MTVKHTLVSLDMRVFALCSLMELHRSKSSGTWTDGGLMSKNGDTYSYSFKGIYPAGTNVYWMVRLTRSGVSQAAFAPAKFFQPNNNPNASAYAYGYWVNTMT